MPERRAGLPTIVRVGLWMSVSVVSFSAMLALVRYLAADLDPLVMAFWRNGFATLMVIPVLMRSGTAGLRTRRPGLHAARAAWLVTSSISIFLAAALMPLAELTAISFTSPLFAVIFAVLILREYVDRRRWLALGLGFAGVLVMLRPGAGLFDPAAWLVLLSSVSFGMVIVTGKQLTRTDGPAQMVALLMLLSVPLSLLPALFVWQWPTLPQLAWLVAMGAMACANMYGIANALSIGDASATQPFDFLRLPVAALFGFLAFGEVPDIWTWPGAVLIFAATVYLARAESVRSAAAAPSPRTPSPGGSPG